MATKDTRSAMRAKEELRQAGDIAARKPFMLRRKFGDPQYAPLDRLWSSADAYLDLAASAIDAAEYFRDQTDREVDKLFWSQFNVLERSLPLADRLAEWAKLNWITCGGKGQSRTTILVWCSSSLVRCRALMR